MAESKIKPLILILSDQLFLRQQPIDILKSRIMNEGFFEFNFESFELGVHPAADIVNAANTMPFASEHRLIIANSVENANKEDLDKLAEYASSPNNSTILVIVGSKLSKASKLYKRIQEKGDVLDRKPPARKDLPSTVLSLFKKEELVADFSIAQALINTVGEDLDSLNQAVIRLKLFLGERRHVEIEDIAEALNTRVEVKPWEFTNALQERNKVKAFHIYKQATEQGVSEIMLLAMTIKMVRELITCRAMIDRGQDNSSLVATKLGKPEWLARRTLDHSRDYSPQKLREIHGLVAEIEEKLKSGGDKGLLFTQLILEF